MIRVFLCGAALAGLMACQPAVPDSSASAQRDAALTGLPAPAQVTGAPLDRAAEPLPASVTAAVAEGSAAGEAVPVTPPPAVLDNTGISAEQNFDAVSAERSIQSDAARIAANRAQYRVIEPTDLPTRPGTNAPNIVEYALRTNNPVGAQIYRRSGLQSAQRHLRNCARFPSPDLAQTEFLSTGGPERDRRGLDPDGDGFACTWDPTPFRAARGGLGTGAASKPQAPVADPMAISSE